MREPTSFTTELRAADICPAVRRGYRAKHVRAELDLTNNMCDDNNDIICCSNTEELSMKLPAGIATGVT